MHKPCPGKQTTRPRRQVLFRQVYRNQLEPSERYWLVTTVEQPSNKSRKRKSTGWHGSNPTHRHTPNIQVLLLAVSTCSTYQHQQWSLRSRVKWEHLRVVGTVTCNWYQLKYLRLYSNFHDRCDRFTYDLLKYWHDSSLYITRMSHLSVGTMWAHIAI